MDITISINNDSTSVTFTCMADGASSYLWQRENGSVLSNSEGSNSSTLLLHNILPSDNGNYRCVAMNEYGMTPSNFAKLTVEGTYIVAKLSILNVH